MLESTVRPSVPPPFAHEPAVLDESKAPASAVLSRFSAGQMLRGKIEHVAGQWDWHFVLDSTELQARSNGSAPSYEEALQELTASLKLSKVELWRRLPSPPLPPRTPGGRARGELPPLR